MSESLLNTPTKRVGVLVLVAGVVLLALGLVQFVGTYSALGSAEYAFRRGPFWALRNAGDDSNATGGLFLWLGAAMVVGGLLASFLYEKTVGKVAHWVKTGSLPRSASQRVVASSKPPSALVLWIGDIILSLLQNWATALLGFAMGIIVYQQMRKPEYVLAPAGIAILFWLQAAIRTGVAGDGHDHVSPLMLLLVVKLVIAYLFFGVGLLLAATGVIR